MTFRCWWRICMMPRRGKWEGLFLSASANLVNSLCTCFSLIPPLWYNSRMHGKHWVVRIRSPSREAGLVEKRQPRCSSGKHHQQTQDTHWVIHHAHARAHTGTHVRHAFAHKHRMQYTSRTDNPRGFVRVMQACSVAFSSMSVLH